MLITVNSSDIRAAFQDMKPLFKAADTCNALGFTVHDYVLYITCNAGVVYERQVAVDQAGPYTITVLYQDLSEIIPARGVLSIDLEPLFVEISSEFMSATLQQANGIVSRYKQRSSSFEPINPAMVQTMADLFSNSTTVSKALKREAPITLKPPYARMEFATFWLECQNPLLDMTISLTHLKALAAFKPTEFSTSEDAVEFRNGPAILAIPRNAPVPSLCVQDLLKDPITCGVMQSNTYLTRIQQFWRSVGAGECRCHLYTDGMDIVVSRPRVQSHLKIGACTELITSFSTFIEYVQMLFTIIGTSPVEVIRGNNYLCLRTPTASMLLSTL